MIVDAQFYLTQNIGTKGLQIYKRHNENEVVKKRTDEYNKKTKMNRNQCEIQNNYYNMGEAVWLNKMQRKQIISVKDVSPNCMSNTHQRVDRYHYCYYYIVCVRDR